MADGIQRKLDNIPTNNNTYLQVPLHNHNYQWKGHKIYELYNILSNTNYQLKLWVLTALLNQPYSTVKNHS